MKIIHTFVYSVFLFLWLGKELLHPIQNSLLECQRNSVADYLEEAIVQTAFLDLCN